MPKALKFCAPVYACLALGSIACTADSFVGTSAIAPGSDTNRNPQPPPASIAGARAATAPKPPELTKARTTILSEPGRRVYGGRTLGDVDGDGYDDFVVYGEQGVNGGSLDDSLETAVHLFYGRPSFPSLLSTVDADAKFSACLLEPIGDVNGDGRADFSFTDWGGTRLVFGRAERYRSLADLDRGERVMWDGETDPSKTLDIQAHRAGDVNGDGYDDVLLWVSASHYDEVRQSLTESFRTYLFWGRAAGWPNGRFDPAWATQLDAGMRLGHDFHPAVSSEAADLDSDGFADLLAMPRRGGPMVAFYGSPTRFSNDAEVLVPDVSWNEMLLPIGDLDADGHVDLASFGLSSGMGLSVHYGGTPRWAGDVALRADLRLDMREVIAPMATSGDIDGDSHPDLILFALIHRNDGGAQDAAVFAVRGTGERMLGTRPLEPDDILMSAPEVQDLGFLPIDARRSLLGSLDASGDIDGDGSRDVMIGLQNVSSSGVIGEGGMVLIPSTPRAPL